MTFLTIRMNIWTFPQREKTCVRIGGSSNHDQKGTGEAEEGV